MQPCLNEIKRQCILGDLPRHWWQTWLLFVLDKPASFLITDGDYQLNDDEYQSFVSGLERMQAGEPLAYVLGYQAFWGRDFLVNEHTLIPRADSEILIEAVLGFKNRFATPAILDLGTGTGCLAITLAKELPTSTVLAVDLSEQALKLAKQNAQILQVHNCQFVQSNWFDKVAGRFHIIVANPPYIAPDDEHLSALCAEPQTALVASNGGLADIEQITQCAGDYLYSDGLLAIEHGYDQAQHVQAQLKTAGFKQVQTVQDYGGNDRLTMGVWGG